MLYFRATVERLIPREAEATADAVESSRPSMFEQLFTAHGIPLPELAPTDELPTFSRFGEAFERYDGRVLLLGEPGAGKTITLLAHARDAIARRLDNPNAPLPMLGLVATWDAVKRTPLAEWLAQGYDGIVSQEALERVIEEGDALLLLDGLDELGNERQEERELEEEDPETGEKTEIVRFDPRPRFIELIELIPPKNQVVLSCRVRDYSEIGQKVALNGAVTLLPLSDAQIRAYLEEQPALLAALEADPELQEMLRSPLVMSLFAFAYRDMTAEDAERLRDLAASPSELRHAIFERYVHERYAWEDRKHGPLPFSREELYAVLGQAAMENLIGGWGVRDNVLKENNFPVETDQVAEFTTFAVRLNLLAPAKEGHWRFVHLLLRDYFAFKYAMSHLHDENADVRRNAAEALGKLGDPRAVEPLIHALHDEDTDVRRRAADALGKLGDPSAVGPLIHAFQDEDANVRSRAAYALSHLGDPRAIEPIIRALHDKNVFVRSSAAWALGELGDPRAVKPLINAMHDKGHVRKSAAVALLRIGTFEALVAVLRDGGNHDRRSAAYALGKLGDPRAVEPLIHTLHDEDATIRSSAADALGDLGDPRAVEPLIHALHDESWFVRSSAADALERIGTEEALAAVKEYRKREGR